MEFPVCSFDLKTGIFCPTCEQKIRRREVTEIDLKVMKLLYDFEKTFPQLSSSRYLKTVVHDSHAFVVFREGDLLRLPFPQQSNLRRKLSEAINMETRLLEDVAAPNRFLQELVSPARIVAVNKIWLPDQSVETRIVLDDERNLRINADAASAVAKEVKGITLRVDFERRRRRLK